MTTKLTSNIAPIKCKQLNMLPKIPVAMVTLRFQNGCAPYDTQSVDRFNLLSWDPLENRQSGAKSVFMYKILNDHTALVFEVPS